MSKVNVVMQVQFNSHTLLLECVSAPVYCMQCVLGQGWETKTHIKYREGEKFGLMSSLGRIYYLL